MQWFQAAPAHWRGSELLLYVSLAHGQQHRHQTSAATTAAAEEHRIRIIFSYTSHRRAPCQGISEAVLGGYR